MSTDWLYIHLALLFVGHIYNLFYCTATHKHRAIKVLQQICRFVASRGLDAWTDEWTELPCTLDYSSLRPPGGQPRWRPVPSPSVFRLFCPFSWNFCWRNSRIFLTLLSIFFGSHLSQLLCFTLNLAPPLCTWKLLDLDCIIFASALRSLSRLASKLSKQVMKSCLTVCLYLSYILRPSIYFLYSVRESPPTNKFWIDLIKHKAKLRFVRKLFILDSNSDTTFGFQV